MRSSISRRSLLKGFAAATGAALGTTMTKGGLLVPSAYAAPSEPTSVVVIYLDGGINAIFTGADAFMNQSFGVTANNMTMMGDVGVDNVLANAIPQGMRSKVASIGVRHGISAHNTAQRAFFANGTTSAPLALAGAIGGSAAIKAAVVGGNSLAGGVNPAPVGGVSLQGVTDMRATIDALAGAQPAANAVDRDGASKGLLAAETLSKGTMTGNEIALSSVSEGIRASVETLQKPVVPFSTQEFNTAYNLQGTAVNNFNAKMAAAELMVRAGTGVVVAIDGGWDTHGDTQGTTARNQFRQRIAPGLTTFMSRMVNGTTSNDRNVIVVIGGDFSRSLPGSDHQANLSVLVVGKYVKQGTTGKTDANVGLPANTASGPGMWAYLAAAAKIDGGPFGANPHGLV
ncbi:MAG: DUF1501 domain-containing protein [Polyangiaceae bacterium]